MDAQTGRETELLIHRVHAAEHPESHALPAAGFKASRTGSGDLPSGCRDGMNFP